MSRQKTASSEIAEVDETNSEQSQTFTKRIVISTSDKGGNGKSGFARTYSDIGIMRAIPILPYDGDKRNAQLYRFYHKAFSSVHANSAGVLQIDLSKRGGADKLINSLDSENTKIVLIDFPAGGGELFERLDAELHLFDLLPEVGYRLTLVNVLSRVKDSVNSLLTLLEYVQKHDTHHVTDWVVVKNLFYGGAEKFRRYDGSKTKRRIEEAGGITICLPELHDDTYDLIDDKDLTFTDALKPEHQLPLADRRRVKVFLEEAEEELMKAASYLGLA